VCESHGSWSPDPQKRKVPHVSLSLSTLDGRVELRELLGQGGMGEVHAAWDRSLARSVAVKFVRGSDPLEAERLLLEARLQARVEHPNVVRVFEVGTLAGRPCIVLQLVRGSTLGELTAELSVPERVELVRQAALGLHAAHLQGLVHRDIKPGNLLVEVGEDGRKTALITDFGLAHSEEGGLTRSGLLPGTLDYMAPQQLAGGGPVDFRNDLYSLGATLYAVLGGRPPFRASSEGAAGADGEAQLRLVRRILEEDPPPLQRLAPDVPRDLALVAGKALEKEPGARYDSAEAFAEDLARVQRGEPVLAHPATLTERALKWSRRNPVASRALAASMAVLLSTGGFIIWLSWRSGLEALEAARLGAAAASLESRMRMEYLSPPHDLRLARAEVKAEVEALKPLAADRGGGPASFALGKGLELLDELDGARAAYELAWAHGFRSPQAAQGLGAVLGRLYQREVAAARDATSPEAVTLRRGPQLRDELLVPARRFLALGEAQGWRGPFREGQIALLEGEFAVARAKAAEALALDPERYEARVLEGQSSLLEGKELFENLRLVEATSIIEQATAPLELAAESGRSDPALLALLAEVHSLAALASTALRRDPTTHAEAALAWADRASRVDPDSAAVSVARGRTFDAKARFALATQPGEAFGALAQAAAHYRRATVLEPRWVRPRIHLAYNAAVRAIGRQRGGLPFRAEVEEGLAVTQEALALAPLNDELAFGALLLHASEAELLRGEGRDPAPALRAAIHHGEALIGPERGNLVQRLKRANANVRQAGGRGDNPALAVIEGLLRAADGFGAGEEYLGLRAMVPLVAATWAVEQGQPADALLAQAEESFRKMLKREPTSVEAHTGLASCSLLEAQVRLGRGEPLAPVLGEGLAHVASAIEQQPREPMSWVLKARLQRAGADLPAARRSLDRAYELEPLARGVYEAKAAEEELACRCSR